MPSYSVVRSANAAFAPSYHPVAVFLGGTSGIGQGMAQVFARITQGNADIIIVGRNQTAAEKFFASLPQPSGDKTNTRKPAREFVECDATEMKNVHTACQEILSRHSKINYLVMSPGFMALSGRDESSEGIDKKLAVHYYSRSRMINDLLPALKNAKDAGEDAKVMSVLAAGKGGGIDLEDLGLKKTYSVSGAALAAPTYNDLMLESYSSRNPSLSFIHAYPGFVRTNIMASSSSTLLSFSSSLLLGLTYPLSVSAEDCGEHMWYAMLNAKEGVHRTGSKGEDLEKTRYFGNEEQRSKLWDHTQEATKVE
ncbi:hypothetical protein B0H34DRAFT_669142 [Crassisporium funariophilum]|nr:hypothetical protein B0H34DRAFT_669142 [Crassisporium funariophilum]